MDRFGKFHQESLKYDKRLLDMNIKTGILSQEDYNTTLANLPDMQSNAAPLNLGVEPVAEVEEPAASPVVEEAPAAAIDYSNPGSSSDTGNSGFGSF